MYTVVDHTADLALLVRAEDRRQFFTSAIAGLLHLLTGEPAITPPVGTTFIQHLSATGFDEEERLVNLLNEFLFVFRPGGDEPLFPSEVLFPSADEVVAQIVCRKGPAQGWAIREIKSATYHNLTIQNDPCWEALIVFDV